METQKWMKMGKRRAEQRQVDGAIDSEELVTIELPVLGLREREQRDVTPFDHPMHPTCLLPPLLTSYFYYL